MLSSAHIRPLIARWRGWLPLAVLLIALASMFALGGDRGGFYSRDFTHNQLTAKNMSVVGNMSPAHNFRLALGAWPDEDGGFVYDLYGRFPISGYALIKFAAMPFEGDLAAKLLAARVLMLLMFCGAAVFAYLALARIAGSRWIALAAALFAFSSLYALYYADAVASETAMDMFGAMLVFHGMTVFVQDGRFRQLLVKTCAALLLGWHVYALILPFALLGFGGEAFALVRSEFASGGGVRTAADALRALARSRFIAFAAVSVLFGSALLALNFANEYAAYGGSRSLRDLPSVDSILGRLGATDSHKSHPDWTPGAFLARQAHRAGVASAPYAMSGFPEYDSPPLERSPASFGWAAWGAAASVAALAAAALFPRRFRVPIAALALMGLCWALAARGNAFYGPHSYEGMFYVGLPLALWSGALVGARRLLGANVGGALAIGIAALAAPIFALSAFHAAQASSDEYAAKRSKEVMADMDAIREVAAGKSVVLSFAAWHAASLNQGLSRLHVEYYLSGSHVWEGAEPVLRGDEAGWARASRNTRGGERSAPRAEDAEYAIIRYRDESLSLTPGNRYLFLYESGDLAEVYRAALRRLEASEPDARSVFDVHLENGALRYLKSQCAPEDADAFFFAHFFPTDPAYLRGEGDPTAFEGVNFPLVVTNYDYNNSGGYLDGACMTTANIPRYPIAAIRTGQYVMREGERLWDVVIFPPPSAETLAAYESAYQTIADGEPAAQSGFDLYLDADSDTLAYLKRPCSEEDARGRFFLSVHPANAADLPEHRRELGHESLNFDFEPPRAVIFNGKCMATIQLPDYEIAKIETGQDAPGGGRLWSAEIAVGE